MCASINETLIFCTPFSIRNAIYQFKDIRRIFTTTWAFTVRQTNWMDKQNSLLSVHESLVLCIPYTIFNRKHTFCTHEWRNIIIICPIEICWNAFITFSFIDYNESENLCVSLHAKYLYFLHHFLSKTCFSISKWHMLISLYLVPHKYVKMRFKNILPPYSIMHQKTFICFCRRTISPMYIIFFTIHAISDMNNIYKFQNILWLFSRVRECTGGQIDGQTECINNFQLCWKLLKTTYNICGK